MNRAEKKIWKRQAKIAMKISERLTPKRRRGDLKFPTADQIEQIAAAHRKAERASSLGLKMALGRLQREQLLSLKRIREQTTDLEFRLPLQRLTEVGCNSKSILDELAATEAEFGHLDIDLRRQTVSVVTSEIELDNVVLGRFRICLDTKDLGEARPYRVIAIDSEYARDCDETSHPHVQSETLCEGEGSEPIKNALAEGRLFDFFVIVRQILQTYNPNSAYTQLADWYGLECSDCGASVDRDDTDSCERCDVRSCMECSVSCGQCDRNVCGSCSSSCESCSERHCDACLSECRDCGESFCDACLTQGLCDDCGTRISNTETETQTATQAASI